MTVQLSSPRPFLGADERLVDAVTQVLSGCGLSLRATDSQEWQLSIAGRRGTARIDEGWLVLDFPPPRGRAPSPLRALESNAELRGNAKHVLLDEGTMRLRAEVSLDEANGCGAAGTARQVRDAVAGLASALGASNAGTASPGQAGSESEASSSDPGALCREAAWSYNERASGCLHVDLDVPGGAFYQAAVRRDGERIVQRLELIAEEAAACEGVAGAAIAALLLRVSGVVRMARATSWRSDRGRAWGFEVQLPGTTTVGAFVHGLAALSVACGLSGREVRALANDPVLARHYLEIRHRRLVPKRRAPQRRLGAANATAS
ncbi:MAG: hypothetical protein PVG79_01655 [Gemmatimonadales bacterium]|jgi:hypothetical protein